MDPLSLKVGVFSVLSVALAVALTPASLQRRGRNAQKRRNTERDGISVGLETVFQPRESPDFDICFVHGLGGRATWTAHDTETNENILWPKELLGKDFPRARILLYGYETNVHSLCWLADRTLYHHASHLLSDLSTERRNCQDRPLLFVAHSLGGLVVKSALVFAQSLASTSDNTDRKIYLSTFGIVSFGTPQVSPKSPPLINFVDELCASQQLSELRTFEDSRLKTRQEDMAMLETRLKSYTSIAREIPEVFCYESLDSALSTRQAAVLPESPGFRHDLCVEIPIEADHNNMCKFHVENDDYKMICQGVSTFLQESGAILEKRRARFDTNIGPDIISGGKIRDFGFSVGPHLPPRKNADLSKESKHRDPNVQNIHERLLEARFAWLIGMNGPGKTSLALDYAYQQAQRQNSTADFSSIFWVDGRCEESLEASFLRIFDILRAYYEREQAPQAYQTSPAIPKDVTAADTTGHRLSARKADRQLKVRHVMDWFSFPENKRWLLIFDDVEHPRAKYWHKYCPRSDARRGYILMICRKDKFGSHIEQDSNTAKHTYLHGDSAPTSSAPSRVNTGESSSSSYLKSWKSSEGGSMLGLESAPTTASSVEDDAQFPPPITVEEPTSPTLRDSLQRLRSRDTDAADDVSDSLAGIGASLCPPEIADEKTREYNIHGGISPELLSWVDASVMLGNNDIPTRFLEVAFGENHDTVLRGLETLQTLGLVQTNRRDRAFHISEDTWRSKRQELDGSQRSAQLACGFMAKTLKDLAKSGSSEANVILDEQLLVEHMEACLDICGRFGSSVECDWDVLADFCERNGLHVEATGFYNAQVHASGVAFNRREDTENSDGRSLSIPERHHRAKSSSSIYDPSIRPRAYRELYSALGAIRMQTKLGKLELLEMQCENVMVEVQKHQYHDLEFEALRRLIDLKRARNYWPEAIEYIQKLANRLEEEKGPSHPDTLSALHQLATTHADEGDYAMAEPLLERILIAYTQMFGHAHLRTVMISVDLAEVYKNHGDTHKAEPLYRLILKTYRQLLGAEHIQTARAHEGLATVYDMQLEYKLADDHFEMAMYNAKLLGEESDEYRGMKKRHAILIERRGEGSASW